MTTIPSIQEIFAANQVLTVEIAQSLIGKRIAVTNPEYRGNKADVRVCTVLGVKAQSEGSKRLVLVYEGENPYATCDDSTGCLPAGTFFGSDADREIYYLVVDEN